MRTAPSTIPSSTRRRVAPHPAEQLDAFADLAADGLSGQTLLECAIPAARALLRLHSRFQVWEVRLELILAGKSDGTEPADAFGALGRSLGLRRAGAERAPAVLPAFYAERARSPEILEAMRLVIKRQHCNVGTIWRSPTPDEAREDAERALEKESKQRRRHIKLV